MTIRKGATVCGEFRIKFIHFCHSVKGSIGAYKIKEGFMSLKTGCTQSWSKGSWPVRMRYNLQLLWALLKINEVRAIG
jgi:hypothetical protein